MANDLDAAIDDYHAGLDATSAQATFALLEERQHANGMLVGAARDRLICSVLRPRFITHAQYDLLRDATSIVGEAIQRAGQAVLDDPALLALFGLTDAEHTLLAIDPGYAGAAAFGRLDGFLAADASTCHFIESNLESPAGIAYDEALGEMFEDTAPMQHFRTAYDAQALPVRQGLQAILRDRYHESGGSGSPRVAIVDLPGIVTASEFTHLAARFSAAGMPTVVATTDDLRYDGGRLYAGAERVDLVYRRVLLHELLAQHDLNHPLLRAYADRTVCVVNPFRTKPVHTKLIMALISDETGPCAGLFSPQMQTALSQHVPWTRIVAAGTTRYNGERVDLLRFAVHQREQLVLKPNDEYGGSGVLLGWQTAPAAWERALEAATHAPYVIQERVPLPVETYPTWSAAAGLRYESRYVDADPLLFGTTPLGCLTRIAAVELLNVSAGGGSAPPTFLIRRRE